MLLEAADRIGKRVGEQLMEILENYNPKAFGR